MPLSIPLIAYLIILLFFIVLSFFIIYHLLNFGFLGDLTKAMAGLYIILALIILVPTFIYILSVDWFNSSINFDTITLPIFQ